MMAVYFRCRSGQASTARRGRMDGHATPHRPFAINLPRTVKSVLLGPFPAGARPFFDGRMPHEAVESVRAFGIGRHRLGPPQAQRGSTDGNPAWRAVDRRAIL